MTNKEKLKALKAFLRENNVKYSEKHKSAFGVTIDLLLNDLKIADFVSDDDKQKENAIFDAKNDNFKMRWIYKPFFVRESESMDFILEKMQNCIVERMTWLQACFEKKNRKGK
jgi:hypothetical protein